MKTTYFKTSTNFFLTLLLMFSLIFVNNVCKSQQINNDNKLIASIDFNKIENNESEQILRQTKSEKIIKHLKLNIKERELLMEIKQLSSEAKQCLKDADVVSKEINEFNKTTIKSENTDINDLKIQRKIRRQENNETSLRYDAEELFEISNSLLFQIYEDHFPSNGVLISRDNKNQKEIIELNNEAQELFSKARKNQDKANYDLNYINGIDYLKKANFLKREAIKKYEQAYYLYYNIPFNKEEYNILFADANSNIANENKIITEKSINNDINKCQHVSNIENVGNNNELNNSEDMIVYRVQIGAFTKKVNINEFHGLYPLLEDKKDQKEFAKYMVGEYFSYKAASEAKRIISSTTNYKDAFVVAYKKDSRIDLSSGLIK